MIGVPSLIILMGVVLEITAVLDIACVNDSSSQGCTHWTATLGRIVNLDDVRNIHCIFYVFACVLDMIVPIAAFVLLQPCPRSHLPSCLSDVVSQMSDGDYLAEVFATDRASVYKLNKISKIIPVVDESDFLIKTVGVNKRPKTYLLEAMPVKLQAKLYKASRTPCVICVLIIDHHTMRTCVVQ